MGKSRCNLHNLSLLGGRSKLPVYPFFLLLLIACEAKTPAASPTPDEEMILVPAGWFWMGQEEDSASNRPRRQVYLDSFAIDRTEVTNAAFAKFISGTGYLPSGWDPTLAEERGDYPVVGVTWQAADTYCHWVEKRLPSEAEWEKAARGTDGRRFPWGEEWDASFANTAEGSAGEVLPVGTFPPGSSPYGCLDMAGNAAEWVADFFDPMYYTYAPDHNPTGPEKVLDHGLRGGSRDSPSKQAQTFFRDSSHSVRPNNRVGFRCAKTIP